MPHNIILLQKSRTNVSKLQKMSEEFNVAVLLTNQVRVRNFSCRDLNFSLHFAIFKTNNGYFGCVLFEKKFRKFHNEFRTPMADPGGSTAISIPKPVGGHVLAHFSTTRLYAKKGKGEQRIVRLVDSPCMPEGEAVVEIYEGGIKNATSG